MIASSKLYVGMLLLLIGFNNPLIAQDDKLDALTFEETIIQEEKIPYFGVGGGFMVSVFSPNVDDINSQLSSNGMDNLSTPITMTGALGVATIGIIPNTRINIVNLGGSSSVSEKSFIINNDNYNRKVSYSLAYTGFGIDYAIQLARSLNILPGISGGWGNLSVETAQYKVGSTVSNGTIGGSLTDPNIYAKRIENSYVLLQPGIALEFAPPILGNDKPRVVSLRLHAGYTLSFMGEWKENGISVITNQPDTFTASGLGIQAGIMIGLFN